MINAEIECKKSLSPLSRKCYVNREWTHKVFKKVENSQNVKSITLLLSFNGNYNHEQRKLVVVCDGGFKAYMKMLVVDYYKPFGGDLPSSYGTLIN